MQPGRAPAAAATAAANLFFVVTVLRFAAALSDRLFLYAGEENFLLEVSFCANCRARLGAVWRGAALNLQVCACQEFSAGLYPLATRFSLSPPPACSPGFSTCASALHQRARARGVRSLPVHRNSHTGASRCSSTLRGASCSEASPLLCSRGCGQPRVPLLVGGQD